MNRFSQFGSKWNFQSLQKWLIGLVLVTLGFLCFGGIFLLPDNFGSNWALRVNKQFKKVETEIFILAPSSEVPAFIGDSQRLEKNDIQDVLPATGEAQVVAQEPAQTVALRDYQDWNQDQNAGGEGSQYDALPVMAAPVQNSQGKEPSRRKVPVSLENQRQKIKEMMLHAWNGYKKYAWGENELCPVSQTAHFGSIFGPASLGVTIVDGLDTLYIMGLEKEYREGRDWIEHIFSLDGFGAQLSVFETNIRLVGGMLSLYALTGESLYKERAQHVADKLLPAFQTPTGIPYAFVNTYTGAGKNNHWASGGCSILSEFGTLHLEFAYLSDITGNPVYRERVQTIRRVLKEIDKPRDLYPNYLNPQTGQWGQQHMSMGALGDSYYEYLLKAWLQSGKTDVEARQMFDEAMLPILQNMVRTSPGGLTYVSDLKNDWLEHKMDHLACFSGGLFALAAATRHNGFSHKYMEVGKGITNTCHESYIRTPTRLGPDSFRFKDALEARALRSQEKVYILRPEVFESYFVLWRLTHDQKYRDWAWDGVLALEKHCRTPHGYSGLLNVYQQQPRKDDVQQSFFLAETLKYLYLLFSNDSVLPLDKWVFNTEAHPLPIKGANANYRAVPGAIPNAT